MFQKMSDEEIERRRKEEDAQKNREAILSNQDSIAPSPNPLHPGIAEEFNQRYGGSLYHKDNYHPDQASQSGIQNVAINTKRIRNQKKKRRRVGFLSNQTESTKQNPQSNKLNRTSLLRKKLALSEEKNNTPTGFDKLMHKAGYLYSKTIGRGLMTSAYLWTNFIYVTLQVWLGIMALIAISFVILIELFVGSDTTKTAFDALMSAIGLNWDFYLLAFLFYLLVIITCYVQLFGVAIQAKTLGLHPLSGHGAYFKTGTFLLCFVLYWVPILNCFPLVNLYIFSIQAYPR